MADELNNDETQEPAQEQPDPVGPMLWYVLKVQSNREKTIRDNLTRRMKREG